METNPTYYGLSTRVQLERLGANQLGIRKVVKSRIIQKDSAKIIEMARQIKSVHPDLELTLICTPNICSKSMALLEIEGVGVRFIE